MDFRVKVKLRGLTQPEQGLRMWEECAPRAEAWAERMAVKLRPRFAAVYQVRRKLATAGVAVLTLWLFAHVMFGANGMIVYRQKKTEYKVLQKQVSDLQKENAADSVEIKALKTDPKTIEQEAREQLHYARPGEVVYVAPPPPPPSHPALDSARK